MINVPALGGKSTSNQGIRTRKSAKMQLLRPKLTNFARQLGMPADVLLEKARLFCDVITDAASDGVGKSAKGEEAPYLSFSTASAASAAMTPPAGTPLGRTPHAPAAL
jgi:hypothetical protein